MDIDLDLTETDAASSHQNQPLTRPSRFAPKGFKPAKPQKPKPEPVESSSSVVEKNEKALTDANDVASRNEELNGSGTVKMEVDEIDETQKNDDASVFCDDKEVEDTVVREIDVFFNSSLDPNTQLYVLQYPLRPCWRPYELDERCGEVRVKPKTAEVEIDLSIDSDSQNFDIERASEFNMTKQTLSTRWKPPRISTYAAGVLTGDKLHLNPIRAVVQLRPSMEHLKLGGQKRKPSVAENGDVIIKSEANEEKLGGAAKQRSKQVDSLVASKTEEECWIQLKYVSPNDHFSIGYLQKMKTQESSPINFNMNPYDYVDSLCPGTANSTKHKSSDRRLLLDLPLEERIKKILLEGPPFQRYSIIKHFAPQDTDEEFLRELQKHALLVQGYWVPKNDLLIPDESPPMKLARDYTLLLFAKNETINISQVNTFPTLSKSMTKYLNVFARKRGCFNDWKFREAMDTVFKKSHPDIFEREMQKWEERESVINSFLEKCGKSRSNMKGTTVDHSNKKLENTIKSDKVATKNPKEIPVRSTTMTKEIHDAVLKALKKLFDEHKVCSYQSIHNGLIDLAVRKHSQPNPDHIFVTAAQAISFPGDLKSIISEVAIEIDGLYALKSSTDNPELDSLRRVVIDLFRVTGRNARFTKTQIRGAAKETLKREITDSEYVKVMKELCESRGAAWFLKGGSSSSK